MSLVESKRFFSRSLIIYAVIQLSTYSIAFYGPYALNTSYMSAPWWRVGILIAIITGLYSALSPALLREVSIGIRMKNDSNPIYFVPVAVVLIEVVCLLVKMYYFWSIDITRFDLNLCLLGYLVAVPVLSIFFISSKEIFESIVGREYDLGYYYHCYWYYRFCC